MYKSLNHYFAGVTDFLQCKSALRQHTNTSQRILNLHFYIIYHIYIIRCMKLYLLFLSPSLANILNRLSLNIIVSVVNKYLCVLFYVDTYIADKIFWFAYRGTATISNVQFIKCSFFARHHKYNRFPLLRFEKKNNLRTRHMYAYKKIICFAMISIILMQAIDDDLVYDTF